MDQRPTHLINPAHGPYAIERAKVVITRNDGSELSLNLPGHCTLRTGTTTDGLGLISGEVMISLVDGASMTWERPPPATPAD